MGTTTAASRCQGSRRRCRHKSRHRAQITGAWHHEGAPARTDKRGAAAGRKRGEAGRVANDPFFLSERDGFRPTPVCRGPWDPSSLHGRVVAGLLAHEIERRHGDPALLPARLTVDLYRLPGFAPVTVTTSIVRDGHRI